MKTFRLIAATFVFAAIFAVSAFAQATVTGKIGVINTQAFDVAKGGITKYSNAMNTLEAEFKSVQTDLQTTATRIQTLQKEIETLQSKATSGVPVEPKSAQAKVDEFQNLQIEFKRKQEDAKVKFEKRELAIMGPIRQDIGNAMQEFAKKNGYSMILDASKLDGAGLILAFDEKFDATKEFITFYNTRPGGTATK